MEESQNSSTESTQSATDATVQQQPYNNNLVDGSGISRPQKQQSQGILRVDTRASKHVMVVPRLSASQVGDIETKNHWIMSLTFLFHGYVEFRFDEEIFRMFEWNCGFWLEN